MIEIYFKFSLGGPLPPLHCAEETALLLFKFAQFLTKIAEYASPPFKYIIAIPWRTRNYTRKFGDDVIFSLCLSILLSSQLLVLIRYPSIYVVVYLSL